MFKHIIGILIVIILSYWTIQPLLNHGYFPMHDDTQPSRIYAMAAELKNGQFPVRIVGGLGYNLGYPIFNFYAPLPYYAGALIYLAGLSAIESTKIIFILSMLLSSFSMFILGRHISRSNIIALAMATLYLYAPYHAVNLYVRGALSELWAFAFFPFLILGIIHTLKDLKNIKNLERKN